MTRRTAIASMLAAPVLANAATEPTPPTVTYNVGAEFIPTDIETEDWTILLDDQTGCVYITVHRDDVDFAVIEVFYKTTRTIVGMPVEPVELVLHETLTSPVSHEQTWGAGMLTVPLDTLVAFKVKLLSVVSEKRIDV